MTYPVVLSADSVPVNQSTPVPFRPAKAGLVTAIVTVTGRPARPPATAGDTASSSAAADGGDGGGPQFIPFMLGVRVEIFKSAGGAGGLVLAAREDGVLEVSQPPTLDALPLITVEARRSRWPGIWPRTGKCG